MATRLEQSFLKSLPLEDGKPVLTLGNVVIESQSFEGALGGLFLGTHTNLQIPVNVRVMHPSIRAQMKNSDRFLEESRKLALIRHPNIAGVLDTGDFDGHLFMVTEYISGVPLVERLRERPLSQSQALALLVPVAEGLCELWRGGFVHRSVAPSSIYVQNDGKAKLEYSVLRRSNTDTHFKAHLAPMLSPYWSPEELRDQPVDPSSDMWSFGATLFHAATGQPPFGDAFQNVFAAVLYGEPLDPRKVKPDLHPALVDVLLKLLTKKPEDRFLTAEAFIGALHHAASQVIGTQLSVKTIMFSELPAAPKKKALPTGLDVGSTLGNCRLEKRAGAGAFGVVYLARHKVLDINVAVKVLPLEIAQRDPSYIDMFLREARTAARIRHPNVISIFEAGEQDGQYYLIMEYVPNGTVSERMTLYGGKLPAEEVRRVMLGTAKGLGAAERFNIIHRDIKPENMMFGDDDEVKLADLGLAKRLPTKGNETVKGSIALDQLTLKNDPNGMLIGTPSYMAPENAIAPEAIDTRADLYSLGVTGFQMLLGKLPFEGQGTVEVLMKHITTPAPRVREVDPSAPAGLAAIIDRLLQKNPDDRYQKAGELAQALEALQTSSHVVTR